MEKEGRGRGEHLLIKKRLNIVARSVAAVSVVAAGAFAVEETGLFDPLSSQVKSANHLVINNLDKSYEQLIDALPKVEDAEANPINIVTNLGGRPAGTAGTIARFQFDDFTHLVFGSFDAAPGWNCTARTNPGDTVNGDKFNCFTYCTPINPVPAIGGALQIAFFNTAKDLHVTSQVWGSVWPAPAGAEAGAQEGNTSGGDCSVGGIAELPDVEALPQESTQSSDNGLTPFEIGGAVAVAGALTAAGVLYTRRKRSAR